MKRANLIGARLVLSMLFSLVSCSKGSDEAIDPNLLEKS